MIPAALEGTIRSVQDDIDKWAASRPANDPLVERRRTEVQAIAAKYRVADAKRTDIRFAAVRGNQKATIEIKIADQFD